MSRALLEVVQLVLVGLLAGEELIVRYGVHPAMDALPDRIHVQTRVALVRRLKVVVPILIVPTVAASIVQLIVAGDRPGSAWRIAGAVALIGFLLLSFLGTVPINMKVNDWNVDAPPADWERLVGRWRRIDTFRSTTAILAFICFVIAAAL